MVKALVTLHNGKCGVIAHAITCAMLLAVGLVLAGSWYVLLTLRIARMVLLCLFLVQQYSNSERNEGGMIFIN